VSGRCGGVAAPYARSAGFRRRIASAPGRFLSTRARQTCAGPAPQEPHRCASPTARGSRATLCCSSPWLPCRVSGFSSIVWACGQLRYAAGCGRGTLDWLRWQPGAAETACGAEHCLWVDQLPCHAEADVIIFSCSRPSVRVPQPSVPARPRDLGRARQAAMPRLRRRLSSTRTRSGRTSAWRATRAAASCRATSSRTLFHPRPRALASSPRDARPQRPGPGGPRRRGAGAVHPAMDNMSRAAGRVACPHWPPGAGHCCQLPPARRRAAARGARGRERCGRGRAAGGARLGDLHTWEPGHVHGRAAERRARGGRAGGLRGVPGVQLRAAARPARRPPH